MSKAATTTTTMTRTVSDQQAVPMDDFPSHKVKLLDRFHRFDTNHLGYLNRSEWRALCAKHFQHLGEEAVDLTFWYFAGQDGRFYPDEYARFLDDVHRSYSEANEIMHEDCYASCCAHLLPYSTFLCILCGICTGGICCLPFCCQSKILAEQYESFAQQQLLGIACNSKANENKNGPAFKQPVRDLTPGHVTVHNSNSVHDDRGEHVPMKTIELDDIALEQPPEWGK